MEATDKESISERSSSTVEAQNLHSLSDSKDDELLENVSPQNNSEANASEANTSAKSSINSNDELFEDVSTQNNSDANASQANTSAKTSNNSNDELFEDVSTQNLEVNASETNTSADSSINSNYSHNSPPDTQNAVNKLDSQSNSGERASIGEATDTEIQNPLNTLSVCSLPTSSVEVVKTLDAGTGRNTEKDVAISSEHNKKSPSHCSDSELILDKSGARPKSQLPPKDMSVSDPEPTVNKSVTSIENDFGAQPRIEINPSCSPSAMARNPNFRTCPRFRYSETRKKNDGTKDAVLRSNDRSSTLPHKSRNSHQTRNNNFAEQSKSNYKLSVSSRKNTDCSNLKGNHSYPFYPDAETRGAETNKSRNLSGRAQNDSFPELERDNNSDDDTDVNMSAHYRRYSLSIKKVESWDCTPLGTQSPDKNSRFNVSHTRQRERSSEAPYLQDADRWNSNLTEPRRPRCSSVGDQSINIPSNSAGAGAEPEIRSSTLSHARTDRSSLRSGTIHYSADITVKSSSSGSPVSSSGIVRFSADFTVKKNAVSHRSDSPVSNSAMPKSAANLPVHENHAAHHDFHEDPVLNNSVSDASPEHQVVHNVPSNSFSDYSVMYVPSPHSSPGRLGLNIAVTHTFSEHPILNFVLFQNSFDCPCINTTLSHLFSDLPVLSVPHSHLYLNNPLPTLFHTYPGHAHRPVLHISLSTYPEHLALFGFSHNSSENPVLNITISDTFSQQTLFYSSFTLVTPPNKYPGQPVLTNDAPHSFSELRVLVNVVPRGLPALNSNLPQAANADGAFFGDSNSEPPPMPLNQPAVPPILPPAQFNQPFAANDQGAGVVQQYPPQQFPNNMFSNQPAYGIVRPRYPIHYFSPEYNFQFPQQAYQPHIPQVYQPNPPQVYQPHPLQVYHPYPPQAYHPYPPQAYHPYPPQAYQAHPVEHWQEQDYLGDFDSDPDAHTDTDQGIYTDTDQEEQADQ